MKEQDITAVNKSLLSSIDKVLKDIGVTHINDPKGLMPISYGLKDVVQVKTYYTTDLGAGVIGALFTGHLLARLGDALAIYWHLFPRVTEVSGELEGEEGKHLLTLEGEFVVTQRNKREAPE